MGRSISRRRFLGQVAEMAAGAVAGYAMAPAGRLFAASATSATSAASSAPSARRCNVVLFLVDDQGFGDLAYHGNPQCKTPNMDALARESVELTAFHVCPVCSPTRAGLMTGRYHFRTGVTDVFGKDCQMRSEEVTVAEALRQAGYVTGIFGKWHLGDDKPHRPMDQGFDESLVHKGPSMRKYTDPVLLLNGQEKQFTGYCTDIFVDHALDFIRRNKARPFFLYVPTNLIHTPLQPPPGGAEPFQAAGLDKTTAAVYAMLKNVDDNLGRLRTGLKQLGLEDDTFFLFTTDNGPCTGSTTLQRFMAGLHGLKGTTFENGIRVPCFARWPGGFKSPGKIDRLAAHIDVMPTVLDACGADKPANVRLDGVSLMPLLRREGGDWPDRTLFFQWEGSSEPHAGMGYSVVTQRYKLVQPVGCAGVANQTHIRRKYNELCVAQGRGNLTLEGERRYLLYDLAADPGEMKDIAPEHPEIVRKLRKAYEAWFEDVMKDYRGK